MARGGALQDLRHVAGWACLALSVALLMMQPFPSAKGQPALDQKAPASKPKASATQPKAATTSGAKASSAPQAAVPDAERIVLLIRVALLTLNDALQTGNFTVLRDAGSPAFRDANTTARLSQVFSGLMAQRIDLSAVAIMAPQLSETPMVDPRNMLRLKGYFPGQPVQINFEIMYEVVGGRWRLFGLSVNPAPGQGTPQARAPAVEAVSPGDVQSAKSGTSDNSRLKFFPDKK